MARGKTPTSLAYLGYRGKHVAHFCILSQFEMKLMSIALYGKANMNIKRDTTKSLTAHGFIAVIIPNTTITTYISQKEIHTVASREVLLQEKICISVIACCIYC